MQFLAAAAVAAAAEVVVIVIVVATSMWFLKGEACYKTCLLVAVRLFSAERKN